MAEFGMNTRKDLIFRANCDASLKKQELRFPRVVILPQGAILEASCVCPANADGRCAHVATLLYLIEDVSYKNTPKLLLPSTSVPQYWGKGKTRDNNPKPAHETQYSKKRKVDRYYQFDPRRVRKPPHTDSLLRGVQSFHRESGFGKLFRFKYTDSEISPERKTVLNDLRTMYESALALQLTTGIDPVLSNGFGAHMAGTVGQGESGAGPAPRERLRATQQVRVQRRPRDF